MAIITISRGSFSMGRLVAEKVAERLGYDIISREILLEASRHFNIPEIKLEKAIHDAPGILERYRHTKQAYIAYIRSALVERVVNDNVVYHGLAGHLLLKGIGHVLKVRINADFEKRVAYVMNRDGLSEDEARARLVEDDNQRRKWTYELYGHDPWDSAMYDLTIRIDRLSIEEAVGFICKAAQSSGFTASERSKQNLKDLALACHVKAELVADFPNIGVTCEYGNVIVYCKAGDRGGAKLGRRLDELKRKLAGIYSVEMHSGVPAPPDAV
ncbi:MAG: histidine kinase [Desulfococcus sp. 4484_241]|nr:MAG: histidine kinase [Desulfococcus sp. 4484_241]